MGIKKTYHSNIGLIIMGLILIGLPVIFYTLGDFPQRSFLKESISLITILAFSLALGLLFLNQKGKFLLQVKTGTMVNIHRIVGYTIVLLFMIHPFLIVVPRYFESGVDPLDALSTLLTTFNQTGVILGMISWILLMIIGLTSYFRYQLPLSYNTWRVLHGNLSLCFILTAASHAVLQGRHASTALSFFLIFIGLSGVGLIVNGYIFDSKHDKTLSNEDF
jgi:predicted ferric reductase